MDDAKRSNRLQNVYSARDNRELASRYDEWAEDYEDDMLSLGYAIPAVAAGFVGRYVPLGGTVLDAGAGTGLFGMHISRENGARNTEVDYAYFVYLCGMREPTSGLEPLT